MRLLRNFIGESRLHHLFTFLNFNINIYLVKIIMTKTFVL
jgi:hypothetical protein